MKRVILIVIDSMGIGAMPDAEKYDDTMDCNTLCNVANFNNGLTLPNLQKMGLGNIKDIKGVARTKAPIASYGIMAEKSNGKDTTTGHWEMTGIVLEKGFKVYKNGFPDEIINKFIEKTGCKKVLGNKPSSGTTILTELAEEHIKTGYPIVYTSADSVFQIACDVNTIPLKTLYEWCKIAREILDNGYNVSRVIARPFEVINSEYKRISKDRRDYSVPPSGKTVLNTLEENKINVIGIGKIEDIFVKSGITHAIHTGTNKEGLELTLKAVKHELDIDKICIKQNWIKNTENEMIFTNLVDTDMLFGHRNDARGYGTAIEEIDTYINKFIENLSDNDLLIITADHGCDPTVAGTDHTREYVPLLVYNSNTLPKNLGQRESFTDIAETISKWFNVTHECEGKSLI